MDDEMRLIKIPHKQYKATNDFYHKTIDCIRLTKTNTKAEYIFRNKNLCNNWPSTIRKRRKKKKIKKTISYIQLFYTKYIRT